MDLFGVASLSSQVNVPRPPGVDAQALNRDWEQVGRHLYDQMRSAQIGHPNLAQKQAKPVSISLAEAAKAAAVVAAIISAVALAITAIDQFEGDEE